MISGKSLNLSEPHCPNLGKKKKTKNNNRDKDTTSGTGLAVGVRAGRAKPGARCAEVSGVSWPSLHRQESPESHESRVRVLALPRSGCTSLGRSLLISGLQSPYPLWGTLIPPSMGDVLSLFFFSFWPLCAACGILVLRSGIEPESVALKVPRPNPWPAGEFPRTFCVGAPTVPRSEEHTSELQSP